MTDIVLNKMNELGVEPTRKNYLEFAYLGTPPEHLSAEEEALLPEQFQEKSSGNRESETLET